VTTSSIPLLNLPELRRDVYSVKAGLECIREGITSRVPFALTKPCISGSMNVSPRSVYLRSKRDTARRHPNLQR